MLSRDEGGAGLPPDSPRKSPGAPARTIISAGPCGIGACEAAGPDGGGGGGGGGGVREAGLEILGPLEGLLGRGKPGGPGKFASAA